MGESPFQMRWGRILLGSLVAFTGSFVLNFLVVAGYAFKLGFEARGAPDPLRIQQFGERVSPVLGPVLVAALTLLAAFWVAWKAPAVPTQHGLLVGVITAVAGLPFAWPPDLSDSASILPTLAAGWLGGLVAARRRTRPPPQPPSESGAA